MVHRVLIVPRWGGGPSDDWYPWLLERIAAGDVPGADRAEVLALPNPTAPEVERWSQGVAARLAEDPARTVVVGHSVGAQAALRALATLPDGVRVAGMLAVAGWRTVDQPWPTIVPWIETPIALVRVRQAATRIAVLLSDDDPFTRDHEATAGWFREAFGADITVAPGGRHFNGAAEPAVLDALAALVGELE